MSAARPTRLRLRATMGFALLSGITTLSLLFAWVGTETLALVAAGGIALLALAPLLAWLNLSGLRVGGPSEFTSFAGLPAPLRLDLERRALLPARDLLFAIEDGRRRAAVATGHLPRLSLRASVDCQPSFAERGRRPSLSLVVESTFPLGLFVARAEYELPIDLLVLPRVIRLGHLAAPVRRLAGRSEAAPRGRVGWGEFHALREWRPGEPMRGVAWRPSARRGRLLARELVSEDEPTLRVVLVASVAGARAGRRHPLFERAVQLAASLLDDLVRRGQRVAFSIQGEQPVHLPPLRGRSDLRAALVKLAEVEASEGSPTPRWSAEQPELPIFVLVGEGEPVAVPANGLVLDVDGPGGVAVFEASVRAEVRRTRRAHG